MKLNELIEKLEQENAKLKAENKLQADVIREIKGERTGIVALTIALARIDELEDDVKKKARIIIGKFSEIKDECEHRNDQLSQAYLEGASAMKEAIEQIFNLSEGG
jgi:hypothetical protein